MFLYFNVITKILYIAPYNVNCFIISTLIVKYIRILKYKNLNFKVNLSNKKDRMIRLNNLFHSDLEKLPRMDVEKPTSPFDTKTKKVCYISRQIITKIFNNFNYVH